MIFASVNFILFPNFWKNLEKNLTKYVNVNGGCTTILLRFITWDPLLISSTIFYKLQSRHFRTVPYKKWYIYMTSKLI